MSPKSITFLVKNMHCQSCPKLISLDLQDLPGVLNVDASLETLSVTINYDPSLLSEKDLKTSIINSGYTPEIIHA